MCITGLSEHNSAVCKLKLHDEVMPSVFYSPSVNEIQQQQSLSESEREADKLNSVLSKCRRSRTVFTELQLLGLEKKFESNKYLSTTERTELAHHLHLTQLQVKTWYQNRRMKWKKHVSWDGFDELALVEKCVFTAAKKEKENHS